MKQEFIRYNNLSATNNFRLVELPWQAESRGYVLGDVLPHVDTTHWLQNIDWQTGFLTLVLSFTKE